MFEKLESLAPNLPGLQEWGSALGLLFLALTAAALVVVLVALATGAPLRIPAPWPAAVLLRALRRRSHRSPAERDLPKGIAIRHAPLTPPPGGLAPSVARRRSYRSNSTPLAS